MCRVLGNFNPRSREGSDSRVHSYAVANVAFQSTLPRGERRYTVSTTVWVLIPFQSTLPRGERLGGVGRNTAQKPISIHAPARGATYFAFMLSKYHIISIHAPARGATKLDIEAYERKAFQSTLPRGERLTGIYSQPDGRYFNPRSREGSDQRGHARYRGDGRFQSTLPRGERQHKLYLISHAITISIHAPARGATPRVINRCSLTLISIHAPARGATF